MKIGALCVSCYLLIAVPVWADSKAVEVDATLWTQLRQALSTTTTPVTEAEALAWVAQKVAEDAQQRVRATENEIAQEVVRRLQGTRRTAILNAAEIPQR